MPDDWRTKSGVGDGSDRRGSAKNGEGRRKAGGRGGGETRRLQGGDDRKAGARRKVVGTRQFWTLAVRLVEREQGVTWTFVKYLKITFMKPSLLRIFRLSDKVLVEIHFQFRKSFGEKNTARPKFGS